MLKTIAYNKNGFGSTTSGVDILKDYWQQRGIENSALNISDGSGLSPQNRVTAHALADALVYAKKQDWFAAFYNSLPISNGIKMKSGSIGGVKSYTGFNTSSSGQEYVFAIIVNNYNCGDGAMVQKLFKVLDKLK